MMQFTDMVVQLVIKQNCIVMSVEKTIRINATKGIKTVRTSGQTSLRGMSIFYKGDKYPMFTFVANCDFGKSNWKMKCEELQNRQRGY